MVGRARAADFRGVALARPVQGARPRRDQGTSIEQPAVNTLAGGAILPRLSFFAIAEETPVVVLRGRVHYLVATAGCPDPSLAYEGTRFALEAAQTLEELEEE